MWVRAMIDYSICFRQTEPVRARLLMMRKLQEEWTVRLGYKKKELEIISAEVAKLQKELDDKEYIKQDLEKRILDCEAKISRAQQLTEGLSDERTRWA